MLLPDGARPSAVAAPAKARRQAPARIETSTTVSRDHARDRATFCGISRRVPSGGMSGACRRLRQEVPAPGWGLGRAQRPPEHLREDRSARSVNPRIRDANRNSFHSLLPGSFVRSEPPGPARPVPPLCRRPGHYSDRTSLAFVSAGSSGSRTPGTGTFVCDVVEDGYPLASVYRRHAFIAGVTRGGDVVTNSDLDFAREIPLREVTFCPAFPTLDEETAPHLLPVATPVAFRSANDLTGLTG